MSSENGENPNRPDSVWCRRGRLKKWKGWSDKVVAQLVKSGHLKTKRFPPARHNPKAKRKSKLGRRYYHVASADKL